MMKHSTFKRCMEPILIKYILGEITLDNATDLIINNINQEVEKYVIRRNERIRTKFYRIRGGR